MKQQIFEVVCTSYMIVSIKVIKEVDLKDAMSETIYASGDFYGESIEGDILEVEVFDPTSVISKSIMG